MTYAVKLDVFEGPLDLLLRLVSKERVNVADVSISSITDEYLRAVKAMGEIDLNLASSFLVMAATLLELKSLKLLPGRLADDPELAALLEERDHLLHRLIEYATFKEVALQFIDWFGENEGYYPRTAGLPEEFVPALPDVFAGLTADKLSVAAAKALAVKPTVSIDASHITPIRVSVGEIIELLIEEIRLKGRTSFRALCGQATERLEVIVRFLGLLELFKNQSVDLEQKAPFDEIVVRWREPI